ncbi:hypothetical protein INT47_011607 [Mucor saturninus]|uniref:Uncharacterized protein n=1 Tax=Mucor saturninus TaxID=64648 RepID=A0A8H7R456_9FUNG|nr:hypothetical protein INT47_011607 [Mucor saturninus]
MNIISREEAVCLFYAVPFNQENVNKYISIINQLVDVDICFSRNPHKPRLLCTRVILANAFDIHLYNSQTDRETNNVHENSVENELIAVADNKLKLESKVQLKQFIQIVYRSTDPKSTTYEQRCMSLYEIMSDLWKYTLVFREESNSSFVNWCKAQKFEFLNTKIKRNHDDSELRISRRELYVLKSGYIDILLKEIVGVHEKYQDYITDLKKEGYCIVGYCRKSKTTGDRDKVVKSLQNMITGLKNRSLVEYIYVTVSCNAKTPINRRDLKKNMIIGELSGVNGDAQGIQKLTKHLIKELAKMSKVCLVVIDSAGLTTNMSGLESFIREHRNIEKIIIDTLAHDNQVNVVECAEEIVKFKSLFKFDGREELFHRSKMLPTPPS